LKRNRRSAGDDGDDVDDNDDDSGDVDTGTLAQQRQLRQTGEALAEAEVGEDAAHQRRREQEEEAFARSSQQPTPPHRLAPDVYALGVLTTGFSNARQFLPWDSDIIVNLTKEKDFHLIHVGATHASDIVATPRPDTYQVRIKNLSLFYRHYVLNDEAYKRQKESYAKGQRSKLYFLRPYANAHCMQLGQQLYHQDLGFPGRHLAKLFVVFMSSERYVGSYVKASNVYKPPPSHAECGITFKRTRPPSARRLYTAIRRHVVISEALL
jgi:hypothetical protein